MTDLSHLREDYEVWLYGSRARGDADVASDTDLLVVGNDPDGIEAVVASVPWPGSSVSFYTWPEVESMWRYGSLFLDHIRSEASLLRACPSDPGRFQTLLASLPRFSRARHDLGAFRRALDEGEDSLSRGGWPDLELQILATVARHAAILACHCLDESVFGRTEPFMVWGRHAGWSDLDVNDLIQGSVVYRFTPLGAPEWINLEGGSQHWLGLVGRLLDEMEAIVDRHEAILRTAA